VLAADLRRWVESLPAVEPDERLKRNARHATGRRHDNVFR
jgi:hypothetical protein